MMKLYVAILFVAFATAGRLDNTYLPPSSAKSADGAGSLSTPFNLIPSSQVATSIPTISSVYSVPAAVAPIGGTPGQLTGTYLPPSSVKSVGRVGSLPVAPVNIVPSGQVAAPISTVSSVYGAPLTAARVTAAVAAPIVPSVTVSSPSVLYGAPVAVVKSYTGPATTPVPILKLNGDFNSDGSYSYEYETANHIAAQESGHQKALDNAEVQGAYSYLAPNGQTITVNYVADENGFRPVGDHLPTPPPIPDAILKSLEINAAAEARGTSYDGQYRQTPSGSVVLGQVEIPQVSNQYIPPASQQGGYRY